MRFALLIMFALPALAFAQRYQQSCPGGNCPLQSSPSVVAVPATSTSNPNNQPAAGWFRHESGWMQEWNDGQLVRTVWPGEPGWESAVESMSPKARKAFGLVAAKPVNQFEGAIAMAEQIVGDDPFPGGVKVDSIPQEVSYVCNGERCDKQQAFQSLLGSYTSGGLVDDRNKMFLTVVGDERLRSKVLHDLATAPALAAWRGKLHTNFYSPTDWQVTGVGLAPGITLQSPLSEGGKSKVLWRLPDYDGDAVAMAEYIRKADPNYRPDVDPNPAKPVKPEPAKPDGNGGDGWLIPWRHAPTVLLGAGILAILILMIRKK